MQYLLTITPGDRTKAQTILGVGMFADGLYVGGLGDPALYWMGVSKEWKDKVEAANLSSLTITPYDIEDPSFIANFLVGVGGLTTKRVTHPIGGA